MTDPGRETTTKTKRRRGVRNMYIYRRRKKKIFTNTVVVTSACEPSHPPTRSECARTAPPRSSASCPNVRVFVFPTIPPPADDDDDQHRLGRPAKRDTGPDERVVREHCTRVVPKTNRTFFNWKSFRSISRIEIKRRCAVAYMEIVSDYYYYYYEHVVRCGPWS